MIKPSGQRYINEIFSIIENDFSILDIYHIAKWKALVEELYKPEIVKYGKDFAEDFDIHVWINNYFFGDNALLLKIESKTNKKSEDLLNQIHKKKKEIRNILNCTKNGTCMFLVNVKLLNIKNKIEEVNGNVCLEKDCETKMLDDEFLANDGRYKTQFLNYVHACNPVIDAFKYELETYKKFKIFDNKLSQQEISNCLKMRSNCRCL